MMQTGGFTRGLAGGSPANASPQVHRRASAHRLLASKPCLPHTAHSSILLPPSPQTLPLHTAASTHPTPLRLGPKLPAKSAKRGMATRTATVEPPATAPAEQPQPQESSFNWTSRWWPVIDLDSLDPKRPKHVDLLGMSFVVFGDSKGEWHCLEDRCPHRLAPLSEGRMEGDELMCSYHGWQFNSQGACTRIPQIDDPKGHKTACSSPRSCAASFPTKKHKGLLWVWPESTPEAKLTSAAADRQPPELEHVDSPWRSAWYIREVPLRYDMLMENVMDPSHVPFTHHGIQGNRNKVVNGVYRVSNVSKDGYTIARHNVDAQGNETPPIGHITLFPPFRTLYAFGPMKIEFWAVPTKAGHSKIMASFPLGLDATRARMLNIPLPIRVLMGLTSRIKKRFPFVDHLERNAVIDGDTYMLHVAERDLYGPASKGKWQQEYFMPANADAGVIAWRQWFARFGKEEPTSLQPQPAEMPREQVLDRFSQHTKHCAHCSRGVDAVDKGLAATVAVGLAAVCAAIATCVSTLVTGATGATAAVPAFFQATFQPSVLLPLALGFAMVGLYRLLQQVRARFFFTDYVHALRD